MTFAHSPSAESATSRSAQRLVHADAQSIFDVLADPFRHHLFDGSGMVRGTPHGPGRLGPGARFTMAQKAGPIPYRSTNDVVEFEEGRRIAWATSTHLWGRRLGGGQIWRYELEPAENGTFVRETHDLSNAGFVAVVMTRTGLADRYETAMAATLERLARLVEGQADVEKQAGAAGD